MAGISARSVPAKRICKPGECLAEVRGAGLVERRERAAEGFVLAQERAGPKEQRREMLGSIDSMDEPEKARLQRSVVVTGHDLGRRAPERVEHTLDAFSRGNGIAESEACREEADHLLVARFSIPVHEVDRISLARRLCVRAGEQCIQAFADGVHFQKVLAILPSQPQ